MFRKTSSMSGVTGCNIKDEAQSVGYSGCKRFEFDHAARVCLLGVNRLVII